MMAPHYFHLRIYHAVVVAVIWWMHSAALQLSFILKQREKEGKKRNKNALVLHKRSDRFKNTFKS